jgi:probable F420-dependent oxidoreductase
VNIEISTNIPSFAAQDPGDWSPVIEFVRMADRAGIDRLVMSDHVVFGENMDAYSDPTIGGAKGGIQPTGPDGAWLEPLTTIAYLSALTTRVRFGTNILIAALRRPSVLAKMTSTIDVLSKGRLDLGVGVGWQKEEYDAAGLSFKDRGRLLDHTLEICKALWSTSRTSYSSPELSFSNIHQMPKPSQDQGIPIWVSGTVNPRSMDRLAKFGQGWIPWGSDAEDLQTGVRRMQAEMVKRGRDPSSIRIAGSLRAYRDDGGVLIVKRSLENVPELIKVGISDFRLSISPPQDPAEVEDTLSHLVAEFRNVTK